MKLLATIALIGLTATPALAGGPRVRFRQTHYEGYCYKNVEKYIPGYYNKHGQWVGGYVDTDRKRVPCYSAGSYRPYRQPTYHPRPRPHAQTPRVDDNSCIEGAVLGGLVGGAAGAGLSRGEGNFIGIPLGIVGGALIGCQIDGG